MTFDGLDAATRRWLDYEQTVNERLVNDATHVPIDARSNTVRAAYRPEHQPVWPQDVVWLPRQQARVYGTLEAGFVEAFGHQPPPDRVPLLLHPQRPASHQRLARAHGCQALDGVVASPTASYRSVLAWRADRPPVVLKLSIGAVIGRTRRALREEQIARAVIMTRLFETIAPEDRARLGLDWCREPGGLADVERGHGWLLRRLPPLLPNRTLVPAFSLISRRSAEEPLLVQLIRRAGGRPEAFVIDRLLAPYVDALSFLLLEHGLQFEGHSQNVLLEVDEQMALTGRLVLRDLSDTSVSIPLRLAKRRPLPALDTETLPVGAPFRLARIPTDYHCNFDRAWIFRGYDTVERYGLSGFVWPINQSLGRFFEGYDAGHVERAYLTRWQRAVMKHLKVEPLFREDPIGLATDESIGWFLRHTDWRALGATPGSALPASAEPVLVDARLRRRNGARYDRVETAWGDLFLDGGHPAFFAPVR
jgi:IucA / IucC family